ncbi:hypothetical protein AMK13_31145 [Streptomyces sp. CB02056]|nr:hypothetical protein AMK13_31145 [Streptomyces sp. CB02056]
MRLEFRRIPGVEDDRVAGPRDTRNPEPSGSTTAGPPRKTARHSLEGTSGAPHGSGSTAKKPSGTVDVAYRDPSALLLPWPIGRSGTSGNPVSSPVVGRSQATHTNTVS